MGFNWVYGVKSIAVERETTYGTEISSAPVIMQAEMSMPVLARKVEDLKFATGQIGTMAPPVVGSKHGSTFTLKYPLQGCKTGYDGTSDLMATAGVLSPELLLFAAALVGNSSNVASQADFKSGKHLYTQLLDGAAGLGTAAGAGTLSVLPVAAGKGADYAVGKFIACSTSAAVSKYMQRGWLEKIATDNLNLFEASGNSGTSDYTALAGDHLWPTATAVMSDQAVIPFTITVFGNLDSQKFALIGCVCVGWELDCKPGDQPMVTLKFNSTDWKEYSTGGALKTYSSFSRFPPVLGSTSADGRLTFGTTSGSGTPVGAATVAHMGNLKITCDYTMAWVASHNVAQGVQTAVITDRKTHVAVDLPFDSTLSFTGGVAKYDKYFEDGTPVSLALYVGHTPGKVFSSFFPSLHIAVQPALKEEQGLKYHSLTLRPGDYALDVDPTGSPPLPDAMPADAVARFGFA